MAAGLPARKKGDGMAAALTPRSELTEAQKLEMKNKQLELRIFTAAVKTGLYSPPKPIPPAKSVALEPEKPKRKRKPKPWWKFW